MVSEIIQQGKSTYYQSFLSKPDLRSAYKAVNTPLGAESRILPNHSDVQELCEHFANFFENKIDRIRATIDAMSCDIKPCDVDDMPTAVS